jgi:histidine ammonia-lyase
MIRPDLLLTPGAIGPDALAPLASGPVRVQLDDAVWPGVEAAAAVVERAATGSQPVYGINTGFGRLATTRIASDQIEELQRRLVVSHMCGVGEVLPDRVVRLVLALKAASLARGHSGVRRTTVERLLQLLDADALPVVPAQGSVGASGDLAPLAHLAGCLIGLGEIRLANRTLPATDALQRLGLAPLRLGAKEGLALLNGTQVSTALALDGLHRAQRVFEAALIAGAMSVDAALGSDVPFEPRINQVRGHPGQQRVAERLHGLLAGSAIRASHLQCERVQDPYSLRCQPQVMGPCLELLEEARATLLREANGVSDNPLVFPSDGAILSGGNFHGQSVAFAADRIALAVAEIGSLSERRTALLIDPGLSQLPAFLSPDPGLNSGFMIAQVTAAALASENQHLAHAVAIDSRVTSAGQEDHVSMSTYAARRLLQMTANAARIIAVELLAAAQGIELRQPLRTSAVLQGVVAQIRQRSAFVAQDRPLHRDIATLAAVILEGGFARPTPAHAAAGTG